MKLTIEIEGTPEQIDQIARQFSNGIDDDFGDSIHIGSGGDINLSFEYDRCFSTWGYDPALHGPDKVIKGVIEEIK